MRLPHAAEAMIGVLAFVMIPLLVQAATPTWHTEAGYRWAELPVKTAGSTGFTLLPPEQTGITFTNVLLEFSAATNRVLQNGAGLALGDFDNDGRLDLFVCGLDSPSALYRNLGNWRFTNVTTSAGLSFPDHYQRGAVFADVDGDGALDLLVSTLNRGVLCFINDGHGHFRDATTSAQTASALGSLTIALADVDGDGTLDLYVANYRSEDIRNRGSVQLFQRNGQIIVPPQLQNRLVVLNGVVQEFGEPDVLYHNDGRGHFTPVPWTGGQFLDESGQKLKHAPLDWGQTAAFRDLDGDGSPDLYVCNDFWTVDRIWINNGRGVFRALASNALRHVCFSSMGVDFADINRDGFLDFLVTDMQSRDPRLRKRQIFAFNPLAPPFDPMSPPADVLADRPQVMRNTLFLHRGDNTYADIAEFAGVASAEWAWQQLFLDVDLDGFEDLLVAAGFSRDVQDLDAIAASNARRRDFRGLTNAAALQLAFSLDKMTNSRMFPTYACPVLAFHNRGTLQFDDVTDQWGTAQAGVHQALAAGDLDGDGAMDLVVNNLNGPVGVYRNNSSAPRVMVRLKGRSPNTQGIGAKIKLLDGAVPMQSQEIVCGGRYLSGSEAAIVFAAGSANRGMTLEVTWRSGKQSVITGVQANRLYEVDEPAMDTPPPAPPRVKQAPPLFVDVSERLAHAHHDEPYNDFARQPLLPRKLSQLGPALAWADLNRDGHDDLVIGTGKGGQLAAFLGDGQGGFRPAEQASLAKRAPEDQGGIVSFAASGHSILLSASSNYERDPTATSEVLGLDSERGAADLAVTGLKASPGPLALGDVAGNGTLELFVGGRVSPGRWPEPASSHLYKRDGDKWALDQVNDGRFAEVGLVSGAVFSDLDGDGFPELVLACEWGPIRVWHNDAGQLREITDQLGLGRWTGWWNGVTTGDLDGDGKLDIITSNWGLNSSYSASLDHPALVCYGDLANRGSVEIIEAEYEAALNTIAPRRRRDILFRSLPFLAERFPTHKSYSEASLDAVLGDLRPRTRTLQATTLASTVFLNRGDHFEAVAMPAEAQFAPGFAVVVADFNGDGAEDVFLSQNFFDTEPSTPRLDAGRGLLLLGDGKGGLRSMPGQESGIKIYGEQRAAATADFDEDGRADLVVAQNGGATKLFQNATGVPGIRVRLMGPPGNPAGVGAVLRVRSGDTAGAAREVHAGSGYWSQDSAVQVLARPKGPSRLEVRWPGGELTTVDLPGEMKELTVKQERKR